ncbi:MAG: acyl-CoA reductase [Bacteroidia bacterium]
MTKTIPRYLIIESLAKLGQKLRKEGVPDEICHAAMAENPWFTHRYIQIAAKAVSSWFDENLLREFVARYPEYDGFPRNVLIITAGNIPLVGWHDLMVVVLSGHAVQVRCSHKDKVLIQWLAGEWIKLLPELAMRIIFGTETATPDFLIATGSDNTARYLRAAYKGMPAIIRGNRYSLAVVGPEISDAALDGLMEDIFLYNGLGCRNISNILLLPGADETRIYTKIAQYPAENLNRLYLERVLHEKAKKVVWEEPFIDCGNVLIQPAEYPGRSEMGVVRKISVGDERDSEAILSGIRSEIQCIAGRDTAFGKTQNPALHDFADEIDTMNALLQI